MATKSWKGILMGLLLVILCACNGPAESVHSVAGIEETGKEQAVQQEEGRDTLTWIEPGGSGGAEQEQASAVVIAKGGSEYTMEEYLWKTVKDVDEFWTDVWIKTYQYEPFVFVSFPAPGEQVPIGCGLGYSNDGTSLYCSEDDQLVISQAFALDVWKGRLITNPDPPLPYEAGDFSIAFYVAHEYAHSLQQDLGMLEANAGNAVRNLELHADCMAGVWTKSVYERGLLETGDLEEVMRTTHDGGDYSDDPSLHHGTPQQRYDAFKTGYDEGMASSCGHYVEGSA
ncbi:neutral zinc metallopeptidase [Planococcus salinus]|nr:neutral zinc metallopeptidase [Planococcus salinus]